MRTKKVVHDYVSYSAPALHDFGCNVILKMTGHPLLSNPDMPLTDLSAAPDDLRSAADTDPIMFSAQEVLSSNVIDLPTLHW
jgi:hypothetical protein